MMDSSRKIDPLGGWPELPADNLPIAFSGHARKRYEERIRAGATHAAVRRELSLMLAAATVTTKRPEWLDENEETTDAYLMLGPDIAAPLVKHADGELVAVTVVFRGMVGDERRENRNERAADRRARKGRPRKVWVSGDRRPKDWREAKDPSLDLGPDADERDE
jgi:hypothetical protein